MHDRSHSSWLIVLLASMVAITPLAIDMYLPAMPTIAGDLATHIGSVQQTLSIYLAAFAVGMLIFGPMADTVGRRPLALGGLFGFALASLWLSWAPGIEWMLGGRAMQAFCGAAVSVVVPGIVRYRYQEHTAKGMSYISMIMMTAPLIAPTLGSGIMLISSWRTIFISQALYAGIIAVFAWRYLPEIKSQVSQQKITFLDQYKFVLANRAARPLIISIMFSAFAFFCYLTGISFIYIEYFQVDEHQFGILFGLNVVMLMIANFINTRLVTRLGSPTMFRIGLISALIFASVLVLVNALGLGLWFTVATLGPLMGSLILVSVNVDAMIILKFPEHSGTAAAVIGTLRFGSGAMAGSLLAFFYTGTATPFSLLMLAGVLGILLCQLWILMFPSAETTA